MSARLGVWPPLPPDAYLRRPWVAPPFPFDRAGSRTFARGRHALYEGLWQSGLAAGAEVLAPAYHHGSEVEALLRSGLTVRFYDATETLEPDEQELERLLGPRTAALYLVHYLGFPQNARRWRQWCGERRLLLIEDAAQAWLASEGGRPVGSQGGLAIFCLYKTFGLPDGAALLIDPGHEPQPGRRVLGGTQALRRHAAWLAGRSAAAALAADRARHDEGDFSIEREVALGPLLGASHASRFLLPRIFDPSVAARRRANYLQLLEMHGDRVPPAFRSPGEGASPFGFPVLAEDKPALLQRLAEHGVGAMDFWSQPHPALPIADFPGAAHLRRSTVLLPVHQELRPVDVERVGAALGRRRRHRQSLHVDLLGSLDGLEEEWSELAARTGNVFATYDWASLWWEHFGGGRELVVTAIREPSGTLVGLIPMYVWMRRPLRVLRFLGHGPGDQMGPVAAPPDRLRVARAFSGVLRERLRWDLVVGEELPGDEAWGALLGARTVRWTGSPVLRFQGRTWDEVTATWSRNLRAQIAGRQRRLEREHEVAYRPADPARLQQELDVLFELHAARWAGRRSQFAVAERFHRRFATAAASRGWLRLWILELDRKPAAAWYGFRFGNNASYYQAGRDPRRSRSSLGLLLLVHSIRSALEEGASEYRFLRGDEAFKYRFANHDPGLETIVAGRGLAGALGGVAADVLPTSLLRRLTLDGQPVAARVRP